MHIKQIHEFKLFDRRQKELVIVDFCRIDDCFLVEERTQDGKIIDSEKVAESFAATVLEQALICLPREDIEIKKLSTGTSFNYPIKQF
jgi:hypothetical protein